MHLGDNYSLKPPDAGVLKQDFNNNSYLHALLCNCLLSEDCKTVRTDKFVILSGVKRDWLVGCHLKS